MDYIVILAQGRLFQKAAIAMVSTRAGVAFDCDADREECWNIPSKDGWEEAYDGMTTYDSMAEWILSHIRGTNTVFVTDGWVIDLLQSFWANPKYNSRFSKQMKYIAKISAWLPELWHGVGDDIRSQDGLITEAASVFDGFRSLLEHSGPLGEDPANLWRRPVAIIPDTWELHPPED